MALGTEELARIDALIGALGHAATSEALALGFERLVPALTLRQCEAADVLEEPFRSAGSCELHLLDVSGHCIRVTGDPDEASGLLIAERNAA